MSTSFALDEAPRFTPKGLATRSRIVGVAADLMYRKGVNATSLDDVQKAAEVSGSQLYHYFRDKQTLVREVISLQTDQLLEKQRPLLDSLDSFEALEAWRDAAIEDRRTREFVGGCELGSFASELTETTDAIRGDLVASFERWEEPIRNGIAAMKARNELTEAADPEALATALLGAVQGGILLSQLRRSAAPFAQTLTAVIEYVRSFQVNPRGH
jgi:TetR/AcrR family transcriptional repressor of nem operon